MGKFQKLQPSGGRPVGGASSALSTSSANARPARPAGPAACGDDDPVRRRNAALLASGGDVVTTRKTFMPGVLTTVPLQVRRAFAPLLGSSQANDRLRLIKKLGAGGFQPQGMIKSKFLSGDTSFKGAAFVLLTGKVESDGSDVGSGSEDEEAIPKGEQFLEHEPLVLDKDGEDGEISVPPLLAQFLRPHQREGVRFVYECVSGLRNGGGCLGSILADDMGLGKTLQSIAVIYTLLKVAGLFPAPGKANPQEQRSRKRQGDLPVTPWPRNTVEICRRLANQASSASWSPAPAL